MAVSERRYPRVPVGAGVFHTSREHKYSPETHQLLKELMAESRLTMLQRKQLGESLRHGEALPARPLPAHGPGAPPPVDPPPVIRLGRRRPKELIQMSGAYEREPFRPAHPKVDKDHEKHVFQDRMAFGKEMPPTPRRKRRPLSRSPEPLPDRFEELLREVDERVQFLREMEALGQGRKYQPIIKQEIGAKLREMERLHKEKSQQIECLTKQAIEKTSSKNK